MYPLREQKKPGLHPIFTCVRGDKGCKNPIPAGMLRKPGDLPQVCPRPIKFKRLATRDTLHGSRPNLQQREPDGRIVPTPPDVWDKGANTKRCARRQKKIQLYIYICLRYSSKYRVRLLSANARTHRGWLAWLNNLAVRVYAMCISVS